MKHMLLCLEQCTKCTEAKELIKERKDIIILTFPHDFSRWSEIQKKFVEKFGLLEDLKTTAPILVTNVGEKLVGYLRIRKWVQNGGNKEAEEATPTT